MRARALTVATLILTLASCSGGTARHARAIPTTIPLSTRVSPLVLDDVSGHLALVVMKPGDYSLKSPITELFGLLSPQLRVSAQACQYLTGRVVALAKKPITLPGGDRRAVLTAELRVTSLERPLVMAYEVTYARMEPDVASIDDGAGIGCITG